MTQEFSLPTPGEILATVLFEPMGLTQYRLGQAIHAPQTHNAPTVKVGRDITADTVRRAIGADLESIEPFAQAA